MNIKEKERQKVRDFLEMLSKPKQETSFFWYNLNQKEKIHGQTYKKRQSKNRQNDEYTSKERHP